MNLDIVIITGPLTASVVGGPNRRKTDNLLQNRLLEVTVFVLWPAFCVAVSVFVRLQQCLA